MIVTDIDCVHFAIVSHIDCGQHLNFRLQLLCTTSLIWMTLYTWVIIIRIETTFVRLCHCFGSQSLTSRSQFSVTLNSSLFLVLPTCYIRALCHWFGWYQAHMYSRNGSGEIVKSLESLWTLFWVSLTFFLVWLFFSLHLVYFRA